MVRTRRDTLLRGGVPVALALYLLATIGCAERPLVVVLTIEDPQHLAVEAVAVRLTPEGGAPERRELDGMGFPVTVTLTSRRQHTRVLRVEALGTQEQVLGRAPATAVFSAGRAGTATAALSWPCDADTDCPADWFCDAGGICKQQKGIGDPGCVQDRDCTSGYCDWSESGPETGRCCAAAGAAGGGGAECCDEDRDCPDSWRCVVDLDGAARYQCTSGQAGATCDIDDDCAAGYLCREQADVCTSGEPGAACDDNGDCQGALVCLLDGACWPMLGIGAAGCTEDADCADGLCDSSALGPERGRCCASADCCDADSDCAPGDQCLVYLDGQAIFACTGGNVGVACGSIADCDAGLVCPVSGFCSQPLADGTSGCYGDSDCASGHCDQDAVIGPETGRCCRSGDCCDGLPGDTADCGTGNYCRQSVGGCVGGAMGESCDDSADCDAGLACLHGSTCGAALPDGALGCSDDFGCLGGHCDLSSLGPERGRCCAAGQCCDADSDCAAGDHCLDSVWQCASGEHGAPCEEDADCDAGYWCSLVGVGGRCIDRYTIQAVSAGEGHTCVLLDGGAVKCWGRNDRGQLGLGDSLQRGTYPGDLGRNLPAIDLGTGRLATALWAGANHTCVLLDNGAATCWGDNTYGQAGMGVGDYRGNSSGEMGDNLPAIDFGTGRTAQSLSAGQIHTCALLDTREIKCWGGNADSQLGLGDTLGRGAISTMGDNLPAVALGLGRVALAMTSGTNHNCALLDNGLLKCWGINNYGQLGLGDTNYRGDAASEMGDDLPGIELGTGRSVQVVFGSVGKSNVLLDDGNLKGWGSNESGQLGLGNTAHRGDGPGEMGDSLPVIALGIGRQALVVGGGSGFTCALLDDGTVKCWGANSSGQLGQGDTVARGDNPGEMGDNLPPIDLGDGRTARRIATGWSHSCVVLDSGGLKCWGQNLNGQLGLGDNRARGDNAGEMGDALPIVDLGTP